MSVQSESDMSDTDDSSREGQYVEPPTGFVLEVVRMYHLVACPPDVDDRGFHHSGDRFHDDEALSGLQEFCDDPDRRRDSFAIHGFWLHDPSGNYERRIYQRLTLSDRVAAAILQTLEKTRTLWKRLQISNTHVNGSLLQVMEAAKSLNTIYSFTIETFGDPVSETFPVLSCFVAENPILTELKLLEVALDLPCLELLKTVLITTPVSTGEGDVMEHSQSQKPQLISLEIKDYMERRLSVDDFKVLSTGFRYNQRLINLSLLNADLESSFPLESLIGHPALETLNLSRCGFSDEAILSLVKVLHHPSCQIQSLRLDECQMLRSDSIEPLPVDILANALANGKCSSIISLSLQKNYVSCDELQDLMMAIHRSCPNLEVLDLTDNCVEQIIWNHSDIAPSVLCANEPLSSLAGRVNDSSGTSSTISSHKACALKRLLLDRNDILHNNNEEERSSTDNANFEELLLDFPALGQITRNFAFSPSFIRFSPKVHTLMSFNRLTRGRLSEGQLPASLWYKVLARIPLVLDCEELEMDWLAREYDRDVDRRIRHARICQASVLFVLLNRHPSQVTLEACREVEDETRCSLLLALLEASDDECSDEGAETIPTKRRKLE